MDFSRLSAEQQKAIEPLLGYLNFSSGAPDPQFLAGLDGIYRVAAQADEAEGELWRRALRVLRSGAEQLSQSRGSFRDASQALAVLDLIERHVVPGYLAFHRDLLFHQTPNDLLSSFLLGRIAEATLTQGAPWEERERIVPGAVRTLNDYIGHRPVAVLELRRHEPYRHEWVRPAPLFIRDAGVAFGPYEDVVRLALQLLKDTEEDLLEDAYFDPDALDELAVPPPAPTTSIIR